MRQGLSISQRFIALLVLVCLFETNLASAPASDDRLDESRTQLVAVESFDYSLGPLAIADSGTGWKQPWQTSRTAIPSLIDLGGNRSLEIRGTGQRNNPLRRELKEPLSQGEIFVRFDLHYRGDATEDSSDVDPEFFVLWMDRLDGGDRATHAANVPNIGVHLADRGPRKGRNVFMIRIGSANTAWSRIELTKDQTYRVVGRLAKSKIGARADYNQFDLWVNPDSSQLDAPDASISGGQSISLVRWIGFATALKTERTDQINVSNLVMVVRGKVFLMIRRLVWRQQNVEATTESFGIRK